MDTIKTRFVVLYSLVGTKYYSITKNSLEGAIAAYAELCSKRPPLCVELPRMLLIGKNRTAEVSLTKAFAQIGFPSPPQQQEDTDEL